jgi:outer membrane lipoprotein-sorting protein
MHQWNIVFLGFFIMCSVWDPVYGIQDAPVDSGRSQIRTHGEADLFARVWEGVQNAQDQHETGCGHITEVRTSKLLVHPLIFRGKFCASGMKKFNLEYFEPERLRLVFNKDYMNVTTGKRTEVFKIGDNVRRTQKYFSREDSEKNLKESFEISIRESSAAYVMKLVPRSRRFKDKIHYIGVTLRKSDFMLRELEIDGTNGVHSLFTIEMESLDQDVDKDTYRIYIP